MGLGFLVPLFLAGLAALAVPVLVHLRHRERNAPVRFPSLMFLRRVPFREVARQQIHHWPLFLLRCLAVALLAFAFARPYLRDRGQVGAIAARTGQDLVVVLDRSASMGYGDRWARGQAAALEALRGLDGSDRGAVVLFDAAAEVAVPLTGDRARLLAAVETARPGSRATRLAGALRAARELLTGSDRPRLQVMVISDFQRQYPMTSSEIRQALRHAAGPVGGGRRPLVAVLAGGVAAALGVGVFASRAAEGGDPRALPIAVVVGVLVAGVGLIVMIKRNR